MRTKHLWRLVRQPRLTREFLLVSLFLLGLVSVYSCTVSIEQAALKVLGKSSQPPEILHCRAVSGDKIEFLFSLPVRVSALHFSPPVEDRLIEEEGALVRISYTGGPEPGNVLVADLLVEDEHGNTINVLASLRTKNDRMPKLIINELRTEYSKPRAEFIELKILEPGNMGAMRVFIAGNYKKPMVYEFAPVEVKAGDLVVLHLRTLDDTSVDELGSNLEESGGADASPTARDLWIPGTAKLLHKTDAVYVLDQDDMVLDAVMLSENPDTWWTKEYFAVAAEFLHDKDAWKAADGKIAGPQAAVDTSLVKTAATRSISRDETTADTNTAADWYVTATGAATPGKPNNPARQQ